VLVWACAALFLLLALALVLYCAAPSILCIESSGSPSSGAIVVLGGEAFGRPARAAELFKAGAAPLIVISGNGDYDEVRRALAAQGIPESALLIEPNSGNTMENARFSTKLLRERGIKRAIIVTSWFHSRRALLSFRHAAPEIEFISKPSYYAIERDQWRRTGISAHIRYEYVKLLGYWVKYGVLPF
jgi:uncharacterized SAM-binding protein YcdF (DUF218 family)